MTESVLPYDDVTFEQDTVSGIPGFWASPPHFRPDEAILHLYGGWFNFGSANAFRHLVAHIAARSGVRAFIPDYRLAPEHPSPTAVDDVLSCYRRPDETNISRIAVTGNSAGGNLALILASCIAGKEASANATLVGLVALSPVTDLTLMSAAYETRAEAHPLFTQPKVSELLHSYLRGADPSHPHASPINAPLTGLPPVRVHVGDDEVLLGDSLEYVQRAIASGVDAQVDVWMRMLHGADGAHIFACLPFPKWKSSRVDFRDAPTYAPGHFQWKSGLAPGVRGCEKKQRVGPTAADAAGEIVEMALYLPLGALMPLAWFLILTPSARFIPPLSDATRPTIERAARNGARNRITGWVLLPFANAGFALALITAAKSSGVAGADTSIWIAAALAIQSMLMFISASRASPLEQARETLSAGEDFVHKASFGADMVDSVLVQIASLDWFK